MRRSTCPFCHVTPDTVFRKAQRPADDGRHPDAGDPIPKRGGIVTGTNLLQQFVGIGKATEWARCLPKPGLELRVCTPCIGPTMNQI
jgi:hypothetical protein